MPTLKAPNEWINRTLELDDLYTKLQIVTGFTAEQLLEMFCSGYTLEKPDYSKNFAELADLVGTSPPNEALTCEVRPPRERRTHERLQKLSGIRKMYCDISEFCV